MSNQGTILAIDDTPSNLEIMGDTLSNAGYTIATAIDGKRALKRLENHQPDLILLDIKMPDLDGFEICRKIKSNPETAKIPIIFITAFDDIESKVKGFSLGGVDYITKPFQVEEILVRVKVHMTLSQLQKQLQAKTEDRERQLQEQNIILEGTIEQLEVATKKLEIRDRRSEQKNRELQKNLEQLKNDQLKLIQSETRSILGQLITGVTRELENPLAFIKGSIDRILGYSQNLISLLELYQRKYPLPDTEIREYIENINQNLLVEDIPKTIALMKSEIDRINNVGNFLQTFADEERDGKVNFNIHAGLDSTLSILKYRLKDNQQRPAIEIVKNYGDIPEVKCYPGQINQVFLGLLTYAIDALEKSNSRKIFNEIEINSSLIIISTELSEDKKKIAIQIADNGTGISKAIKEQIFTQGFTSKEMNQRMGLGIAIAKQIIEEKHSGAIACYSELGKGTEFMISLPC